MRQPDPAQRASGVGRAAAVRLNASGASAHGGSRAAYPHLRSSFPQPGPCRAPQTDFKEFNRSLCQQDSKRCAQGSGSRSNYLDGAG